MRRQHLGPVCSSDELHLSPWETTEPSIVPSCQDVGAHAKDMLQESLAGTTSDQPSQSRGAGVKPVWRVEGSERLHGQHGSGLSTAWQIMHKF